MPPTIQAIKNICFGCAIGLIAIAQTFTWASDTPTFTWASEKVTTSPRQLDGLSRQFWSERKYEESLRISELMAAKYPDDLWACCMAVRNKVMCLQMLGRYDESTSAARGAIERFGRSKASIGDWLPLGINTQFIMTIDIGDNLRSQKSYDKAFQEYQRARQYLDNYLNTECTSPALAAAGVLARYSLHRKLAEWYADTGQYEKAAGVCEEWIAAIGDLLTSETAHFLPNREWMILRQRLDQEIYLPKQAAGYYEKAGRPEKAKELRNRVLSVSQEAVKDGRYKSVPLFHKGVEFLLKELEKPTAVQP